MNLDAYDDMMGLEFGDYGMEGLFDPQMLKEALIASTAGGGAILLATFGMKKLTDYVGLESKVSDPLARSAIVSTATLFLGLAAGRGLYRYNPTAASGLAGAVGGIAMANLLDALISKMTGNARMLPGLGEVSGYADDGMSALAQLEATSVQAAPGAFQGFQGPTVTPEQLMGFESAVTQTETLGEYAPYLS